MPVQQVMNYVRSFHNTIGKQQWVLTEAGLQATQCCWRLQNPGRLLAVRNVPVAEMTKYELMTRLEDSGWKLQLVSGKRALQTARSCPYKHLESPLEWYIREKDGLGEIKPVYLQLLLTAGDYREPIPHFATMDEYRKILDPSFVVVPRKRKVRFHTDGDDWCLLQVPVAKKRSRQLALTAREFPCNDAVEDDLLVLLDEVGRDDPGEGSVSEDSTDCDDAKGSGAAASGAAVEAHSSSSSSSSSSGSSSSSDTSSDSSWSPKHVAKPVPEPKPKAKQSAEKPGDRVRSSNIYEPFGACFFTPRYKDGVLSGLQMSCTRPAHNVERKCTKELSFGVAGGEQNCRRMLKTWIVLCASVPSRSEHMIDSWKLVTASKKDGNLMSEHQLDAQCIYDWEEYDATTPVPDDFRFSEQHKSEPAGQQSLLGLPLKGVPQNVHSHMEELARAGAIPLTTAEQRSRQKFTLGNSYGVPTFLADARRFGYISPNLEPPAGFIWKCTGGNTWSLHVKGG